MAECVYTKMVRSLSEPTLPENQTFLRTAFKILWEDNNYLPKSIYTEIWDFFYKGTTDDLQQPYVVTRNWPLPPILPNYLQQGEHLIDKYHPHAKVTAVEAFNPLRVAWSISTYEYRRRYFQTEQQFMMALAADMWSWNTSKAWHIKYVITSLFLDLAARKALEGVKDKNIDSEFNSLYEPDDHATKGYIIAMDDLSFEKTFLPHKDGKPLPVGTTDASAKQYLVTENPIKDTFECLKDCINTNVATASKSTIKFYAAQGNEELAKWVGFWDKIQDICRDAKNYCTYNYNIAYNSADPSKCVEKCKKINSMVYLESGIKRNIGCCKTCKDNGNTTCCCTNAYYATTEDLALFVNPADLDIIKRAYPLFNNTSQLEISAAKLGVSRIFECIAITSGQAYLIDRRAINFLVFEEDVTFGDYPIHKISNMVRNFGYHAFMMPYICMCIKKTA